MRFLTILRILMPYRFCWLNFSSSSATCKYGFLNEMSMLGVTVQIFSMLFWCFRARSSLAQVAVRRCAGSEIWSLRSHSETCSSKFYCSRQTVSTGIISYRSLSCLYIDQLFQQYLIMLIDNILSLYRQWLWVYMDLLVYCISCMSLLLLLSCALYSTPSRGFLVVPLLDISSNRFLCLSRSLLNDMWMVTYLCLNF